MAKNYHPKVNELNVLKTCALVTVCIFILVFLFSNYPSVFRNSTPDPISSSSFYNELVHNDTVKLLSFGARVSGTNTTGWVKAHQMVVGRFEALSHVWSLSFDNFTQSTILGKDYFFSNIIATLTDGDVSQGHIVLAAHFDSKLFDTFDFLGASDSAVPCMMLLNIAERIASIEKNNNTRSKKKPKVTIIFFDGEEAYKDWTDTDSLYGARHLAKHWKHQGLGPLSSIQIFLLLDLLGPTDSVPIPNYFPATSKEYLKLSEIDLGLSKIGMKKSNRLLFQGTGFPFLDDHIPFLKKGVPILHLAKNPFPSVWHTAADGYEAMDWPVIYDLTEVLYCFVRDYLI